MKMIVDDDEIENERSLNRFFHFSGIPEVASGHLIGPKT